MSRYNFKSWIVPVFLTAFILLSIGSMIVRGKLAMLSAGGTLLILGCFLTIAAILKRKVEFIKEDRIEFGTITIKSGNIIVTDDDTLVYKKIAFEETTPAGAYKITLIAKHYSDGMRIERVIMKNGDLPAGTMTRRREIVVDTGLILIVDGELCNRLPRSDGIMHPVARQLPRSGAKLIVDAQNVARGLAVCPPEGDGVYYSSVKRFEQNFQLECVFSAEAVSYYGKRKRVLTFGA